MTRHLVSHALALGLSALAIAGCQDEASARKELERDGYTNIRLVQSDHRFDFTADKGGQRCSGTISERSEPGSDRRMKFASCSGDNVSAKPHR